MRFICRCDVCLHFFFLFRNEILKLLVQCENLRKGLFSMKSRLKFMSATIFVWLLFVSQVHAQLCSSKIRFYIKVDVGFCSAVPLVGWFIGITQISEYQKKAFDADALDAASILSDQNVGAGMIANANLIIDKFYHSLEKKYPRMKLGRNEVIDVLNNLNINGVKNGHCPFLTSYYDRLAILFFPDEKAQSYLESSAKYLQKEQDVIEAQIIRNEKNSTAVNINYQDLSEDEDIKNPLVK